MIKIIIGLILFILMSFYFFKPLEQASAVGIIGGADGPTALFIASKTNPNQIYTFVIVGVLCILMAVLMLKKKDAVK